MNFSDEQIKDMLEMKERTLQKIEKYQKEIKTLEKQLEILDSIVKQSSFTKASSLPKASSNEQQFQKIPDEVPSSSSSLASPPTKDSIPITRGAQGQVIANAYVTPEQVSIILDDSLDIDANTPPLKTFFLDRIIGEMKKKDEIQVSNGAISSESVIDYIINKSGPNIREIIVRNYKQKERADEIINTAGWSLNRMLENVNK